MTVSGTYGSRVMSWSIVNDGIVSGRLIHRTIDCDVCGEATCCVRVDGYKIPEEIPWSCSLIAIKCYGTGQLVAVNLGVGCGCYAKLHRQIAHIRDSIEEGRRFPQT